MKVLITNAWMSLRYGTESYVRDLALGLLAEGHTPVVYSPLLGQMARELRERTIPVVDDLNQITLTPDIIHGQQNFETVTALLHFPKVPAVYFFHTNLSRLDIPPKFPRILRYVAVDETCRDRMIFEHGIPADRVSILLNSVDLNLFQPRTPLPTRPRRALVFSNASNRHLPAVREACKVSGLELDVIGFDSGNPCARPELALPGYDIVFAKARCALEAMAVGAAVVLCDAVGVGPLVTTSDFERLRQMNFGHRTLQQRLSVEAIIHEIARYDSTDAHEVSRKVRAAAGRELLIAEIIELYQKVIEEHGARLNHNSEMELKAAADYLSWLSARLREEAAAFSRSPTMRLRRIVLNLPVAGWLARSIAQKSRRFSQDEDRLRR